MKQSLLQTEETTDSIRGERCLLRTTMTFNKTGMMVVPMMVSFLVLLHCSWTSIDIAQEWMTL